MLPYFRSMEAFSISLPQSWSELSDQQLLFFFRQVARDLPLEEVTAICLCKWAHLSVLCFDGAHRVLVRQRTTKREVWLADWQLAYASRQLSFLGGFAEMPVRISELRDAAAVAADLQGVSFEDYLAIENFYQGFLHTQSLDCLSEMAHLLYPLLSVRFTLSKAELLSVFYWFASVKLYFTKLFPNFFSAVPNGNSNLLGTAPTAIGETLRQAMNAQIRALTAGDITKETRVLEMDCWRALTELDAKAKEAESLRKMG